MNVQLSALEVGRNAARDVLAQLSAAIDRNDLSALESLFATQSYWRDILALTWSIRTRADVGSFGSQLLRALRNNNAREFTIEEQSVQAFTRKAIGPTVEAFFRFETDVATCRGYLRLRQGTVTGKDWRVWILFTSMEEIKGHEEKSGHRRPVISAGQRSGTWLSSAEHARHYEDSDPDTVIVGGAQTGLALAARLGALDVPALVVEREARIGDVWRNRYQSLILHNQIWANHFPFMPFPSSWPVYLSKDQLASWLEIYAEAMSIAAWTSTTVADGSYDEAARRWTLTLRRGDGTLKILSPRNVVLASGVFGSARRLALPGAENFDGTIVHASNRPGRLDAAGLRVLVVGSGSSAHDVALELHGQGADVTMLQRSSTCIVSLEPGAAIPYSIYKERGLPVDDADMIGNSIPFPVLEDLHKDMTRQIADLDRELIDGLNAAGFETNLGDDGSGFLMRFFRVGGGYYINVGASDRIVSGDIKVINGTTIQSLSGHRVEFADGRAGEFDLIVVAVGYDNMQETVRSILGDEVADKVGPIWGFDDEFELRNMWKPTAQPGLWLAGGSLQQNRPFSKYLALQIKARQLGLIDG